MVHLFLSALFKNLLVLLGVGMPALQAITQRPSFNGLETNLNNLFRLSAAQSRSSSPENITGEKGKGGRTTLENGPAARAARDLGTGWKVNSYLVIQP